MAEQRAGLDVTGHTRTSTEAGPDYCAECSEAIKNWVKWPCEPSQRQTTHAQYGPWCHFEPITEPEPWLCDHCDDPPNLAEWEHHDGTAICTFHFEAEEVQ